MSANEKITQLRNAMAALEAQRAILGDAVVDMALGPLRDQLAKLEQEPVPAEPQRKQCTVLFADMSGYTAMSQTMDAEDVSDVVKRVWDQLDKVMEEAGGTIVTHMGDGVMAIWGARQVREDDPENAIRAGLKMQVELAALRQRGVTRMIMRVGINTGPVMVGYVAAKNEFTALGDTVNVASRLEHAAPLGGVLVSHATYRHVRGIFRVAEQPPLMVKGKSDALQTYVIEGLAPRSFKSTVRGIEDVTTKMVGRKLELEQLRRALDAAISTGRAQAITVIGDAGVGKSRLIDEFKIAAEALTPPVVLYEGRAGQEMQAMPYGLLRDLLVQRFGILENDALTVVQEKLLAGMAAALARRRTKTAPPGFRPDSTSRPPTGGPGFDSGPGGTAFPADIVEMRAHFVGHLMGFDFSHSAHIRGVLGDKTQIRDRAVAYLVDYFRAVSTQSTLLMLLEDIHWADERSLELLERLAIALTDRPAMLVFATRPVFLEKNPRWGSECPNHQRIRLQPLSAADSGELVAGILLKLNRVPAELREMVVSRAEGNPFYVEELVRMMLDEGIIIRDGERWRVDPGRLAGLRVPPTLTALLQSRFDSLAAKEKETLQRASVIGRIFWDQAVLSLGEKGGAPVREPGNEMSRVETDLQDLQGREMVLRRPTSAFFNANEFAFAHALVRDVVYEAVLKRERRIYHALAAEWLLAQSGKRANEIVGIVAEHLERAGQNERAAGYFRQAGEQAFALSAFREALGFFERAETLLPPDNKDRVGLGVRIGESLLRLGAYAPARARLEGSLAAATQCGDTGSRSAALSFLAILALNQGNFAESRQHLQQSLQLARDTGNTEGVAHALIELGWTDIRMGAKAEAKDCFEESLRLFRSLDNRKGVARALGGLAVVADLLERYDESEARRKESLEIFKEMGSRQGMSVAYNNLGELARIRRDFKTAQGYYQQSLDLAQEIDDRRSITIAVGNLGHVSAALGDDQAAGGFYLEAIRVAKSIEVTPWVLDALAGYAGVLARAGDEIKALELLGLVLGHPALYADTKPVVESILQNLRQRMAPDVVEQTLSKGKTRDLNEVVTALLGDTGAGADRAVDDGAG